MKPRVAHMVRGTAASKGTAIRRQLHSPLGHRRSSSSYAISSGQWRYCAEREPNNCAANSGSVLAGTAFERTSQVGQPAMFIARDLPPTRRRVRTYILEEEERSQMRSNGMRWWVGFLVVAILTVGVAKVHADDTPLATAVLLPSLISSVAQQLVPLTVELPDKRAASSAQVKIATLVYCGTDDHGGGYAVGIAIPAESTGSPTTLSAADCHDPLTAVAKRTIQHPGAPSWIEALRFQIAWVPWQLTVKISEVAPAAKPGASAPSFGSIQTLASYATSNLAILPPPGSDRRFDVAFSFPATTIVAALFASGRTSDPFAALTAQGSFVTTAEIPAQANVLVSAQYAFVNALLRLYASEYEVPVPVQGWTGKMLAKDVQVTGADNSMTASGQLLMGNITYRCKVHSAGPDLVIKRIELDPIAKDCTSDDLMERLQCQGEQLATSGSSESVANALTNYYQGTPFHYSSEAHPLEFNLFDRQVSATFEALKSSSKGTAISEAGRASIQTTASGSAYRTR